MGGGGVGTTMLTCKSLGPWLAMGINTPSDLKSNYLVSLKFITFIQFF